MRAMLVSFFPATQERIDEMLSIAHARGGQQREQEGSRSYLDAHEQRVAFSYRARVVREDTAKLEAKV